MLAQRQTPSVQVFNRVGSGMLSFGLNIFISNQFIQYNTIVNHTNIRIRTEAKAYQVLLLYNILTKCKRQ